MRRTSCRNREHELGEEDFAAPEALRDVRRVPRKLVHERQAVLGIWCARGALRAAQDPGESEIRAASRCEWGSTVSPPTIKRDAAALLPRLGSSALGRWSLAA